MLRSEVAQKLKKFPPITDKFIKEYPIDWNGQAAYMRASGNTNKKSSAAKASRLLKDPEVVKAIENYVKDILGPQEKSLLGNVNFWEAVRDGELPEGRGPYLLRTAVLELLQEYEISPQDELYMAVEALTRTYAPDVKITERLKASENLGKYAQMFVEKKEVEVTAAVTIVDDIGGV